jgi:hypothetical protein
VFDQGGTAFDSWTAAALGIGRSARVSHEPHHGRRQVHLCTPPHSRPVASERSGCSRWCRDQTLPADRAKVPRSQDPEDAIEDATVVYPRNATRLVGQHRLDGSPFIIGEFIAHDSSPPVWELESQPSGQTQRSWPGPGFGAFGAKRTSTSRQPPLNPSKMATNGRLSETGDRLSAARTAQAAKSATKTVLRLTRQSGCDNGPHKIAI